MISTRTYERLAEAFGVHPSWLSPTSHDPPTVGRDGKVLVGHVFPGTARDQVQQTPLGLKALYWFARTYRAVESLGVARSDEWVKSSPVAGWFDGRKPPSPVMEGIDGALARVAREWGAELGKLPLSRRRQLLGAWHQAWALTLEAACEVRKVTPAVVTRERSQRRR